MLTFLLALQLGVAQGTGSPSTGLAPDSAIRARVDSATRAFQTLWRYAWQETQNSRPSLGSGEMAFDDDLRGLALHCHWIATPFRIRKHVIKGPTRAHATCPMWYPPGAETFGDERRELDAALPARMRPTMQAWRLTLRQLLDSAAAQIPGDERIAGQRVRFALDERDLAGAAVGAADCNRNEVQCGLLRALVLYRSGNAGAADSAFLWAADAMDTQRRCAFTDISVLLEGSAREAYDEMTCAARAQFEARLWWLADPLYLERGNERRGEHFARKTLITLLSPLGFDGRQHWLPSKGGEGVTETLMRYGWPTHMYWAGHDADIGHDNWLREHGADTARPYVVREYSRDRLHTLPLAHALASPFYKVAFDDWRMNAPRDGDDDEWWPVEHYARDRSRIEGLPEGQSAMLLRREATRFLWAGDLDGKMLMRANGEVVRATLFEGRAIGSADSVRTFGGRIGRPLAVDAPLQPGVALLGIEIPGDSTRAAARARFGVEIPATLASLGAGRAVSQPILFEPPANARSVVDADSAVARMYGTTTFPRARRLGVYWEAYGFPAGDTVDIELRMSREDRPGILERVGDVLRIGREDANRVNILWREVPGSSRAVHRMEGSVPVGMHSIVLDLSRLSRGTYNLQITVRGRAGARAAGTGSTDRITSTGRSLVLR